MSGSPQKALSKNYYLCTEREIMSRDKASSLSPPRYHQTAHAALLMLASSRWQFLSPALCSICSLRHSSHCQLSLSAIALLLCRVYQLSLVTQAIGVLRRLHVIVGRKSTWNQQVDLDGDGAILAPVHRASLCMRCVSALCLWMRCVSASVYGLSQCTVPLDVLLHHTCVCAPQCTMPLYALCQCTTPQLRYLSSHTPLTRCK